MESNIHVEMVSANYPSTLLNFATSRYIVARVVLDLVSQIRDIVLIVRDTHGGGWSRNINARYLHTLMVYL